MRAALQEPAWSQLGKKAADARTRLWSAAIAQLFLQRGNILSAAGLFGVPHVKEGVQQSPRSVRSLLMEAESGDGQAWLVLVDRMVPNLIHAPQPLITPGQGSEAGEQRKGVRRTPASAVAALEMAFTQVHNPAVTREMLIAFAKAVLEHSDATRAPTAPDGTTPICYGEQDWEPGSRTPIVAGMILVPGIDGNPTSFVVDKEWFDQTFPPVTPQTPRGATNRGDDQSGKDDDTRPDIVMRAPDTVAADPRARLGVLRRELPARIELTTAAYERAVQSADALMADFETARRLRADLEEQSLSADQRVEWMEKLTKARGAAEASVVALQQVEALILQL
ncbi:hypothetical protein [Actinomadura rupiterrae]|uniref:hypothetical protein n=1 Tax=Actinomadura rupiterrae TaxID=559627 RepID=UPI0020A2B8C4|nr:hypothetical protein [Actinomadura rupiterrae]MCP2343161.1 hypothetical protein [Actinomadura rupiterrae]